VRAAREVRRKVEVKLAERHKAEWGPGSKWERLVGAGLFDAAWYVAAYPDVETSGLDPLAHFVALGAGQGRNPNEIFDTPWYRLTYAGQMADVAHPVFDYLDGGAAAGRDPGPRFQTSWYTSAYPDVADAGINPLAHYLLCGRDEGRQPRPSRAAAALGAKVAVVSGEPHTPGHHYRVVRLADAIRHMGGSATVFTEPEAAGPRASELLDVDVVILWRTPWNADVRQILRQASVVGARVVFDLDDLMVDPDLATLDTIDGIRTMGLDEDVVRDMYRRIRQTAAAADACTCTTRELARPLRHLGKVTHVVPNGFDDDTVVRSRAAHLRSQAASDGLCRIGYASGSRTHQRDFAVLAEPLADVLRAHPHTRLVVFRRAFELDEFPAFDDLRDQVEWRDMVDLDDLPDEVARFDVNLAPLEVGNPFCEAKSELKYFEAALVDVVTVASPTGPFRRAIDPGVTGFLAEGVDEWRSTLEKLVVDDDLRRDVARAAREDVLFTYGTERRAQRIKSVLDQVMGSGAGGADAFALEVARDRRSTATPSLAPVRTVFEHDRGRASQVTVVIPVYNYAGTVVEALDSVRAQTIEDLDLIVVEDDSPDDSLDVVRAWAEQNAERFNRLIVLSHIANAGLACSRNRGFQEACTPFVLPLDADNVLLPDCVVRLLDELRSSGAAFAYPHIRQFGPEIDDPDDDRWLMGRVDYSPGRLAAMNYLDAMALVRRAAWREVGGYRVNLLGWEDWDLWCSFAEAGLYGLRVPEELARYRVHGESMLRTVTHTGDRPAQARRAITELHPWLDPDPFRGADTVSGPAGAPSDPLSRGARDDLLAD